MATRLSDSAPCGPATEIDAWLRAGADGEAPCDGVIETSISYVYLFPDRALKFKKPVDLGFLDFSTLEKRQWACEREVAFNRETAPDIYRRTLVVVRDGAGRLGFGGAGEIVDWAVEMRRFDETAVLSNRLAAIDGAFAETLGRDIGRFHARAMRVDVASGSAGLAYVLASNAHLLRGEAADVGADDVEALIAATDRGFADVAPLLDDRARRGFVRCCHGDLHLGNILLEHGAPVLFDCIEFSDSLRDIDVLYDIAFLLMDLAFRGADGAANRVFNAWLDQTARVFGESQWAGLAALPLFQSVRAAVRAHVNALEGGTDVARRYIAAAGRYLEPAPARLIAVGGVSGSGKSTLARALAPRLGAPPGAVVLRSDEIRKRLWGRDPTLTLPSEAYSPAAGEAVYDTLLASARTCLAAGRSVIADAVFLNPGERDRARHVAADAGVAFQGVWLEGPPTVLRERISARVGDASDADERVLARQLEQDPGPIDWLRATDANSPLGLESLRRRIGLIP